MCKKFNVLMVLAIVVVTLPGIALGADPNMIGIYWMDAGEGNTVWDYSGNGRNGTINGAVSWSGFGKMKLPIPVTVPIKWAGDTPVISVTDLKIAMFPPYSARIVLYRGQYAGTWHGKGYGGKIFGRIEKIKQEVEETPASPQPKAEPKETKPEPEADAGK